MLASLAARGGTSGPVWRWPETPSESQMLELEKQAMERETNKLLTLSVPPTFVLLPQLLKECQRLLTVPMLAPGEQSDESGGRITFEMEFGNNRLVKGFLALVETRISAAEITVKFAQWNRGHPFTTSISPSNPWPLSQIQNTHNLVQTALHKLADWRQKLLSIRDVRKVMEEVAGLLQQAREQITLPGRSIFPKTLFSNVVFNPPLPPDLVVEFSVLQSDIILSIYFLNFHPAKDKAAYSEAASRQGLRSHLPEGSLVGRSLVGQTVYYKNHIVEVVDHAQIRASLINLYKAQEALLNAYDTVMRLFDKTVPLTATRP